MKHALATALLLGGLALAGGRESGPVMPMPMNHANHAAQNHAAQPMSMQMADMLAPLRPLKGKAFDVAWVKAMIDHHGMALDMARHELAMGQDARVKAAAQKVIDAQNMEIKTMQGWLRAWTGESYAPMPMQMNMTESADRWFLTEMIPHHQGAIEMSNLIPARTQNGQLRQLGQAIIRAQSAEIAQYRELFKTVK